MQSTYRYCTISLFNDPLFYSVIFRSRNPHHERPLPHLIGSKEWTNNWHVGLVESDDEAPDDEEADNDNAAAIAIDEFSSSEDDTISMSVSLPSNVQTASENSDSRRSSRPSPLADNSIFPDGNRISDTLRPHVESRMPAVLQSSHTLSRPRNFFDDSDTDSEVNANVVTVRQSSDARAEVMPEPVKPTEPDAQRVRVLPALPPKSVPPVVARPQAVDAPDPIFRQPTQQRKPSASIGFIADEPPELDAPVAATRKPHNRFFEDSDDDEDMIEAPKTPSAPRPPVEVTTRTPKVPPKMNNLFDSTDDSETDENHSRPPALRPSVQPTIVKSNISQLFDDSPSDDLFDVLIAKKTSDTSVDVKKKSVFDFDEDELFGTGPSVVVPSNTTRNSGVLQSESERNSFANQSDKSVPTNLSTADVQKKSIIDSEEKLFGEGANKVLVRANKSTTVAFDSERIATSERSDNVLITKNSTAANAGMEKTNISDFDSRPKPSSELNAEQSDDRLNANILRSNTNIKKSIFDSDDDDLFGQPKVNVASIQTEVKSSAGLIHDIAKPKDTKSTNKVPHKTPTPVKSASNLFDDIFGDEPPEDEFASIFAKAKPSLNVPTNRKSLFDTSDDLDNWEPASSALKTKTASLTEIDDDRQVRPISAKQTTIAEKPAVSNEPVVSSKASTPEQYANFYATDKTDNGAKLVEDRRPFVSYLDNELPSDTDELTDGCGDMFACVTDSTAEQRSKYNPVIDFDSDDNQQTGDVVESAGVVIKADIKGTENEAEIVTPVQPEPVINQSLRDNLPIIANSNAVLITSQVSNDVVDKAKFVDVMTVEPAIANIKPLVSDKAALAEPQIQHEPPPVDTRNETNIKPTVNAYLFDDEPPVDDFLSSPSNPVAKPTPQLNAAFFDTLPPNDNFYNNTSSGAMFDDLPPDDDDPLDVSTNQTSQLAGANSMALFEDLPPDDDLFPAAIVSSTTVTTDKKVFYEDFEYTIVAPFSNTPRLPMLSASPEMADAFREKINRFTNAPSDRTPESVQPKPKKLNTNLQINVAALLPGAKRSPPVIAVAPTVVEDGIKTITSSVPTNTREVESSSGLLVGLTKGRARPMVRRNPSTRQGRLNELSKSLSLVKNDTEQDDDDDDVVEPKVSKSIAEMLNSENNTDIDWLVSSKGATAVQTPIADDLPVSAIQKSAGREPTKPPIELFSDDDDSDDLFGASIGKKKINESFEQLPAVPLPPNKSTLKKTGSSLFADTVDDDDDDLFGTINRSSQSSTAKPAPRPNRALFDESDEDDDDDLFGTTKKNTTGECKSQIGSFL